MEKRDLVRIFGAGLVLLTQTFIPIQLNVRAQNGIKIEYNTAEKNPEPENYIKRGKGPVSAKKQKELADFDDLAIITEKNLGTLVSQGYLVRVPEKTNRYILVGSQKNSSVTDPYNKLWLEFFSFRYHSKLGKRMEISSLTRTVEHQRWLRRNGYNYAVDPRESGHVRGISTDISYENIGREERIWLRDELRNLQNEQVLSFVPEPDEQVYHVTLFKENFLSYYREQTGLSLRQLGGQFNRLVHAGLPSSAD